MNLTNCSCMIKRLFLALTIIGCLTGCGKTLKTQNDKDSLLNIDRQFSKLSAEKGIYTAFDTFMADSAIMYRENGLPMKGRTEIRDILSKDVGGTLLWEPFFADIASSGNPGYTLGEYEHSFTDSTGQKQSAFGNYVTIWRKQADGNWKFVFDAGTKTPPAKAKKVDAAPLPERKAMMSLDHQDR